MIHVIRQASIFLHPDSLCVHIVNLPDLLFREPFWHSFSFTSLVPSYFATGFIRVGNSPRSSSGIVSDSVPTYVSQIALPSNFWIFLPPFSYCVIRRRRVGFLVFLPRSFNSIRVSQSVRCIPFFSVLPTSIFTTFLPAKFQILKPLPPPSFVYFPPVYLPEFPRCFLNFVSMPRSICCITQFLAIYSICDLHQIT